MGDCTASPVVAQRRDSSDAREAAVSVRCTSTTCSQAGSQREQSLAGQRRRKEGLPPVEPQCPDRTSPLQLHALDPHFGRRPCALRHSSCPRTCSWRELSGLDTAAAQAAGSCRPCPLLAQGAPTATKRGWSARLCEVLHRGCQRRQHRVHAGVTLRHGRAKVATSLQRNLGVSRLGRIKQRSACRAGGGTQLCWEWPRMVARRVCDTPVRRRQVARSGARALGLWRVCVEPQKGRRAAQPRSHRVAAAER